MTQVYFSMGEREESNKLEIKKSQKLSFTFFPSSSRQSQDRFQILEKTLNREVTRSERLL